MSWLELTSAIIGGGVATKAFDYLSKRRREQRADAKRLDELSLAVYERIAAEQSEWRERLIARLHDVEGELVRLRSENAHLNHELSKLRAENVRMSRRQAELESHNASLAKYNAELEGRYKELERELRGHAGGRAGV